MGKSEVKKCRIYSSRYSCLRRALGCRQFADVSVEVSCNMGVGEWWVAKVWHLREHRQVRRLKSEAFGGTAFRSNSPAGFLQEWYGVDRDLNSFPTRSAARSSPRCPTRTSV